MRSRFYFRSIEIRNVETNECILNKTNTFVTQKSFADILLARLQNSVGEIHTGFGKLVLPQEPIQILIDDKIFMEC